MATTYRQGIYRTDTQESYEVETRGYARLLPRQAKSVFAIFGMFKRLPNGHLLYTMDSEMMTTAECHAAYLDDLSVLRDNETSVVERF